MAREEYMNADPLQKRRGEVTEDGKEWRVMYKPCDKRL